MIGCSFNLRTHLNKAGLTKHFFSKPVCTNHLTPSFNLLNGRRYLSSSRDDSQVKLDNYNFSNLTSSDSDSYQSIYLAETTDFILSRISEINSPDTVSLLGYPLLPQSSNHDLNTLAILVKNLESHKHIIRDTATKNNISMKISEDKQFFEKLASIRKFLAEIPDYTLAMEDSQLLLNSFSLQSSEYYVDNSINNDLLNKNKYSSLLKSLSPQDLLIILRSLILIQDRTRIFLVTHYLISNFSEFFGASDSTIYDAINELSRLSMPSSVSAYLHYSFVHTSRYNTKAIVQLLMCKNAFKDNNSDVINVMLYSLLQGDLDNDLFMIDEDRNIIPKNPAQLYEFISYIVAHHINNSRPLMAFQSLLYISAKTNFSILNLLNYEGFLNLITDSDSLIVLARHLHNYTPRRMTAEALDLWLRFLHHCIQHSDSDSNYILMYGIEAYNARLTPVDECTSFENSYTSKHSSVDKQSHSDSNLNQLQYLVDSNIKEVSKAFTENTNTEYHTLCPNLRSLPYHDELFTPYPSKRSTNLSSTATSSFGMVDPNMGVYISNVNSLLFPGITVENGVLTDVPNLHHLTPNSGLFAMPASSWLFFEKSDSDGEMSSVNSSKSNLRVSESNSSYSHSFLNDIVQNIPAWSSVINSLLTNSPISSTIVDNLRDNTEFQLQQCSIHNSMINILSVGGYHKSALVLNELVLHMSLVNTQIVPVVDLNPDLYSNTAPTDGSSSDGSSSDGSSSYITSPLFKGDSGFPFIGTNLSNAVTPTLYTSAMGAFQNSLLRQPAYWRVDTNTLSHNTSLHHCPELKNIFDPQDPPVMKNNISVISNTQPPVAMDGYLTQAIATYTIPHVSSSSPDEFSNDTYYHPYSNAVPSSLSLLPLSPIVTNNYIHSSLTIVSNLTLSYPIAAAEILEATMRGPSCASLVNHLPYSTLPYLDISEDGLSVPVALTQGKKGIQRVFDMLKNSNETLVLGNEKGQKNTNVLNTLPFLLTTNNPYIMYPSIETIETWIGNKEENSEYNSYSDWSWLVENPSSHNVAWSPLSMIQFNSNCQPVGLFNDINSKLHPTKISSDLSFAYSATLIQYLSSAVLNVIDSSVLLKYTQWWLEVIAPHKIDLMNDTVSRPRNSNILVSIVSPEAQSLLNMLSSSHWLPYSLSSSIPLHIVNKVHSDLSPLVHKLHSTASHSLFADKIDSISIDLQAPSSAQSPLTLSSITTVPHPVLPLYSFVHPHSPVSTVTPPSVLAKYGMLPTYPLVPENYPSPFIARQYYDYVDLGVMLSSQNLTFTLTSVIRSNIASTNYTLVNNLVSNLLLTDTFNYPSISNLHSSTVHDTSQEHLFHYLVKNAHSVVFFLRSALLTAIYDVGIVREWSWITLLMGNTLQYDALWRRYYAGTPNNLFVDETLKEINQYLETESSPNYVIQMLSTSDPTPIHADGTISNEILTQKSPFENEVNRDQTLSVGTGKNVSILVPTYRSNSTLHELCNQELVPNLSLSGIRKELDLHAYNPSYVKIDHTTKPIVDANYWSLPRVGGMAIGTPQMGVILKGWLQHAVSSSSIKTTLLSQHKVLLEELYRRLFIQMNLVVHEDLVRMPSPLADHYIKSNIKLTDVLMSQTKHHAAVSSNADVNGDVSEEMPAFPWSEFSMDMLTQSQQLRILSDMLIVDNNVMRLISIDLFLETGWTGDWYYRDNIETNSEDSNLTTMFDHQVVIGSSPIRRTLVLDGSNPVHKFILHTRQCLESLIFMNKPQLILRYFYRSLANPIWQTTVNNMRLNIGAEATFEVLKQHPLFHLAQINITLLSHYYPPLAKKLFKICYNHGLFGFHFTQSTEVNTEEENDDKDDKYGNYYNSMSALVHQQLLSSQKDTLKHALAITEKSSPTPVAGALLFPMINERSKGLFDFIKLRLLAQTRTGVPLFIINPSGKRFPSNQNRLNRVTDDTKIEPIYVFDDAAIFEVMQSMWSHECHYSLNGVNPEYVNFAVRIDHYIGKGIYAVSLDDLTDAGKRALGNYWLGVLSKNKDTNSSYNMDTLETSSKPHKPYIPKKTTQTNSTTDSTTDSSKSSIFYKQYYVGARLGDKVIRPNNIFGMEASKLSPASGVPLSLTYLPFKFPQSSLNTESYWAIPALFAAQSILDDHLERFISIPPPIKEMLTGLESEAALYCLNSHITPPLVDSQTIDGIDIPKLLKSFSNTPRFHGHLYSYYTNFIQQNHKSYLEKHNIVFSQASYSEEVRDDSSISQPRHLTVDNTSTSDIKSSGIIKFSLEHPELFTRHQSYKNLQEPPLHLINPDLTKLHETVNSLDLPKEKTNYSSNIMRLSEQLFSEMTIEENTIKNVKRKNTNVDKNYQKALSTADVNTFLDHMLTVKTKSKPITKKK